MNSVQKKITLIFQVGETLLEVVTAAGLLGTAVRHPKYHGQQHVANWLAQHLETTAAALDKAADDVPRVNNRC